MRPARAPAWLPTHARQRARAASTTLHRLSNDVLKECRADPAKDAPLVRALIAATDPLTQKRLSDKDIADELIFFLFAAHDNHRYDSHICNVAAGRHLEIQHRVATEVARFLEEALTPDDVLQLPYTVQVLKEALRLCPPGPTGTRMATRDIEIGGYAGQSSSAPAST